MAVPASTLSEEIFTGDTTPSETPAATTPSTISSTPEGSATPTDTSAASAVVASTSPPKAKDDAKTTKGKSKAKCAHKKRKVEEKEKAKKEQEEKEKAEKEKEERERKEKEELEKKEKEEKEKENEKEEKKSKKDKKSKKSKRKSKKSKKAEESAEASATPSDSSSSDSSDSDSDSDSSSSSESSSSSSSDSGLDGDDALAVAISLILAKSSKSRRRRQKEKKKKVKAKKAKKERRKARKAEKEAAKTEEEEKNKERASVLEYKRVDELWDKEIHDYKITDTVPHTKTDEYSSFIFTVRRVFDYENKYVETQVDIKSVLLKEALAEIIGEVRGVSLIEDVPEIDPNMLFNFLPELEAWVENKAKVVVDSSPPKEVEVVKRKVEPGKPESAPLTAAEIVQQQEQVKLLIKYLNEDYASTKATLDPLLANSMITFDLMWAILKPNTIMYTTCAGSNEPRAFKLEYAQKQCNFMRGKWWSVEGRFLEYDGMSGPRIAGDEEAAGGFGWGTVTVDIDSFKSSKKIGSLACYPFDYRKDKETMKATLIERGRKFVSLQGMQYKMHKGMAFVKKKRQYIKVHINGRIMIDPATFRRINPNYLVSSIKSRSAEGEDGADDFFEMSDTASDDSDSCCCDSDEEAEKGETKLEELTGQSGEANEEDADSKKMKWVFDDKGQMQLISKQDVDNKAMKIERLGDGEDEELVFTEEELLTASPVVLGWAFTEKLWLEFPVSGVEEIKWNEKAFDSLVLPDDQKAIVKALVESHTGKNIASSTIDDVIQGKGRGLVSVLHGPPGVGKTLTAEGIAELLKRPLYCVSSGELGTNPAVLEQELNKILDIAHSWGAVLLLDEADVFLERRTMQDMHRNALVSIFLRLLEYFQGILFLTTNRVETFDDAFQSRIHVALRYNELGFKAKVKIWKMFLEMVREKEGPDAPEVLNATEIEWLAKKKLNGRQIKNSVRTAQALASNKKERLTMKHIKTVLAVAEGFENDLKGTGQLDSMNSYA